MKYLPTVAAFLFMIGISAPPTNADNLILTNSSLQQYSKGEYDAFNAADLEQDPTKKIALLDDFARKYPQSVLLVYIYTFYCQTYEGLKNFPKVIEYADKLVALGDRADASKRYAALYVATTANNNMQSDDPKLAAGARARALAALGLLSAMKRPDLMDDRAFADEKNRAAIYLHATAGNADLVLKDYAAATQSFNAVIELSKPVIRVFTAH